MTRFDRSNDSNVGATMTLLFLLVSSVVCLGCGKSDWGRVSGIVTVDGKPVGPGTLVFEPSDEARLNASSALGYFDATGKYELVSAGKKQGAPVGNYRVIVMEGGPASLVGEASAVSASRDKNRKIPPKYADYDAGLSAKIEPGRQEIDFELVTDKK